MRRGLSAVKELKNNQGSYDNTGRRFVLKDGETALIRIYGSFEDEQDPIICSNHYIKRLPAGHQYQNCAQNVLSDYDASSGAPPPHAGCVFCYEKNKGDKGIGASNRALFHVKDFRKYHKLEQEARVLKPGIRFIPGKIFSPDSYVSTKYPPCSMPKSPCMYCNQGNKALLTGHRYWELSVSYADQLVSQQAELRTFCKCGAKSEDGSGTIYATQYLCSNIKCGNVVEFYPEQGKPTAYCGHCRQNLPPLEEIACTACDAPRRCDLQDFFFRVTRTGGGTDTTYNFEAVHPCKPPKDDELEEAAKERPNFEEIIAPEPAELQAAHLGIQSPFATTAGHGAQPYGGQARKPPMQTGPAKPGSGQAMLEDVGRQVSGGFKIPKLNGPKIPKLRPGEPAAPASDGGNDDSDVPY